jgi:AcrR family transcriptional regulator
MSPMIAEPANARSRRTRATLLTAARAILEEDGFDALTMAAVADRAGVTRRAVYLHFAGRAELVGGLFDHVAEAEGLGDSLARVWAAPDAASALDEWARHLARYHTRLLSVDRAVERVRRKDPDAGRHRERVVRAKLKGCRRLAGLVAGEGRLADGWTVENAADMLFALTSSDVVEGLTVDRRWSRDKLATHLGALLRSTFLSEPGRAGGRR